MPTSLEPDPEFGWHRPPPEGYFAEDLDRIPGLPAHAELIDGSLVLRSIQSAFHSRAVSLLESGLDVAAPWERFRVSREMSVVLGRRQRPTPDLVVVHAAAEINAEATWYPADAVLLAVEVVSPDSEERDRERKPQLYAKAGIKYFWRVENADGRMVIYAYELDPAAVQYVPVGIFHDRVNVAYPYDIDIDLTEIDRM
ncbi:Uma2 family endonuclease [Actinoplanes lutulentus]|uniref:Uma2 family endonuclease n=1 Tax=Actinoplanes lutulentus TaxID=1287878 RepID=A0A327ZKG3_9ACTN|nr:Uma2 family endonuclease [Actinoplanes lutulentus]MBB2941138.1 Uma2 family endonuclease [Actinoplanes lutulentus]RAK43447.1 Uma2 family endonuclease [Actinoplanes lutulentus]